MKTIRQFLSAIVGIALCSCTIVRGAGVVADCDQASLLTALEGGGTVTFACDGTIYLTNAITIEADTILDGPVAISGGGSNRLFIVSSNATLSLKRITLLDGMSTNGGAILNHGNIAATVCTFSNNLATGPNSQANGGAILNAGAAYLTNSTFVANTAQGADGGYAGYGGAIYNLGNMNIEGCTFRANASGGGYGTRVEPIVAGAGGEAGGGAVCNAGLAAFVNCTFAENTSTGGTAASVQHAASNGGSSIGGAFLNTNGTAFLTNCTFAGNSVIGGYNGAAFAHSGLPGEALGGSLANTNGVLSLKNSIVAHSISIERMAIYASSPQIVTTNQNAWGMIFDFGHNLSSDATCNFTNASSLNSTEPLLGPLLNNGGPTETMFLLPGSPAIDTGDGALFPPIDQRGYGRPDSVASDMGAVEMFPETGKFVLEKNAYILGEETNITITVWRTAGYMGTASVEFSTSDGTALAGSDYVGTNGTLVFLNNETVKTFSILAIPDEEVETNETLSISLSSSISNQLGSITQAKVTIPNEDTSGLITFVSRHLNVSEYDSHAVISVLREGGAKGGVSVKYATGPAMPWEASTTASLGDYTQTSGVLHFGENETNKTILVSLMDDNIKEGEESFAIELSEPYGATIANPNSYPPYSRIIVNIADDDHYLASPDHAALAEAIGQGGIIRFASDQKVYLTNAIVVTNTTILNGLGHSIIISGSGSNRLFTVKSNASLTLLNMTLIDGRMEGADASSHPPSNPMGEFARGGAILNEGALFIGNCVFSNNTVKGGDIISTEGYNAGFGGIGAGGAIYNSGALMATNTIFKNNSATGGNGVTAGDSWGGAIFNSGTVALTNISFLTNTTFGANTLFGPNVYTIGEMYVSNCRGGALASIGGHVAIESLLFEGNSSLPVSVHVSLGPDWPAVWGGGSALGGAVFLTNSTFSGRNAVFSNNFALGDALSRGGALFNDGQVSLVNSRFFNNKADGRFYGTGGGAIYNQGHLILTNATLEQNLAKSLNGAFGGAILNESLVSGSDNTFHRNSVLSGHTGGGGAVFHTDSIDLSNNSASSNFVNLITCLLANEFSAGSEARFTVIGSADLNYDWFASYAGYCAGQSQIGDDWHSGITNVIGTISGPVYTRSNLQASDSGNYLVAFDHDFGGIVSLSSAVAPVITAHPQGGEVALASNVNLSVTAAGVPLVYHWFFNELPLLDATNSHLSFTAYPSNMGSYFVVVSNELGTATSAPVVLTMVPFAPVIIGQPRNIKVSKGSNASVSVSVTATEPFGFQWRLNGEAIPGATDSSYNIAQTFGQTIGNYSVVISNAYGSLTSAVAQVSAQTFGDFNNDSRTDILFQNANGQVTAWLMNSSNFLGSAVISGTTKNWHFVGIADFDGNEDEDWILRSATSVQIRQRPATPSSAQFSRGVASEWRFVGTADLNHDGYPDIAWQNSRDRRLAAWLMGSFSYQGAVFLRNGLSAAAGWSAVGLADFNADGESDLLFSHVDGRQAVWLMNQTNYLGAVLLRAGSRVAPGWNVVGLNDLNDDGRSDILWRHKNGTMALWFMNQTNFLGAAVLRNGLPIAPAWKTVGIR